MNIHNRVKNLISEISNTGLIRYKEEIYDLYVVHKEITLEELSEELNEIESEERQKEEMNMSHVDQWSDESCLPVEY